MRKSGRIRSPPSVCSAIHPKSPPSTRSFPPMKRWRSWLRCAAWMRWPRARAPRTSAGDWGWPGACASPSTTSLTACARSWRSSPPSSIARPCSFVTRRSTASMPPARSKPRRPFALSPRKAARSSSPVTSRRPSSGSATPPWCYTSGAWRACSSARPGDRRSQDPRRWSASSWRWPAPVRPEMAGTGASVLATLLCCVIGAPAFASAAVDTLLLRAHSTPELRAMLRHHAATAPDSLERGEALYYLGMSYEREGKRDSAILGYEGAVARRNDDEERKALMDALLRRRRPGDADRVLQVLARPAHNVIGLPVRDVAEWNGRQAG